MTYIQFTDFRNRAKEYFEKVESGSSFIIIKRGKPVAKIVPFVTGSVTLETVKKKILLKSKRSSAKYLQQEREGE
jgi:prevent-host-death family protein